MSLERNELGHCNATGSRPTHIADPLRFAHASGMLVFMSPPVWFRHADASSRWGSRWKALWSLPLANRLSVASLTTYDSQANWRVLAANVDVLNVMCHQRRCGAALRDFREFASLRPLKDMRRYRVTVAWPVRHKIMEAKGLAPTQAAPQAECSLLVEDAGPSETGARKSQLLPGRSTSS